VVKTKNLKDTEDKEDNMPKSKLRKNHKQKVQAWKQKNENITKQFNNKLRAAIASQNNPNLENGEMKIQVS
jgi:hypothetical protein